ncbi:MAG: sulfurtransferase [Alphaproteobacteria bacterium]|nr:sulfurtransferase [Alphaproteobacteria bacterium]
MAHHAPRFLALCEAARGRIREMGIDELRARLQHDRPPVVVDVREDREWAAGRIPGAVHLGKGVIERDVEDAFPDLDEELVLYCGGGFRSALAAEALQQMGYRNVWSLAGGRRGWLAAGAPWDAEPVPSAP